MYNPRDQQSRHAGLGQPQLSKIFLKKILALSSPQAGPRAPLKLESQISTPSALAFSIDRYIYALWSLDACEKVLRAV